MPIRHPEMVNDLCAAFNESLNRWLDALAPRDHHMPEAVIKLKTEPAERYTKELAEQLVVVAREWNEDATVFMKLLTDQIGPIHVNIDPPGDWRAACAKHIDPIRLAVRMIETRAKIETQYPTPDSPAATTPTNAPTRKASKAGRKPERETANERRILEAWDNGNGAFKTKKDLAENLSMDYLEVCRIIDKYRKRDTR